KDPFNIVQEQTQISIEGLASLHQRWSTLLKHSNTYQSKEFQWCQTEINVVIKHINEDIEDLKKTIDVVLANPSRFNVSASELDARKRFIRQATITVEQVSNDIKSPQTITKIEQDKRSSLMPVDQKQHRNNQQHQVMKQIVEEDNNDFLRNNLQLQQQMMREQDQSLDELSESIKYLGKIGMTMTTELTSQGKILDNLNDRADHSLCNLNSVMRKLDRLM
ncbi:hypothetical protein SAMD00019534_095560, partial [Acytostelium subglobosum LB1]|uniref:hypothetical protein n=1 Tax=Acytostelium subglobosum LB1 TaxID=1410327 RepID=UPI0006448240